MRLAIVGCGYAADYYIETLPNHPSLELVGVYDRVSERQLACTQYHRVPGYSSIVALLDDPAVDLVVNLTNPSSHAEVTEAALMAGKHVYVEKPLALDLDDAKRLVGLANERGLALGSAPCNLLGNAAQTAWRALRRGLIGTPRLAYAELEAGPIPWLSFRDWASLSGAPWPYVDEFATGCTLEHAPYYLTWLTAFFGPAVQVTAFAACVAPLDHLVPSGTSLAPDLTVACMAFADGMVARLTCGLTAPKDQSLRIIGDEGMITVADGGHFTSPVTIARGPDGSATPLSLIEDDVELRCDKDFHNYDFARGVADLADAVSQGGRSHLPIDHALHVLELALAIARATDGVSMKPDTTFAVVEPPAWAV